MELKCKRCGYEHQVAPQFFKGTKEHQCPGCSTVGNVVVKVQEVSSVHSTPIFEVDESVSPESLTRATVDFPVSGGSGAEELTRDEAPATPEDPQPSQDPEEDKPRAKKKRGKPDSS